MKSMAVITDNFLGKAESSQYDSVISAYKNYMETPFWHPVYNECWVMYSVFQYIF